MSLHILKLCVGCDSVKDLEGWIKQKLKALKKGARREHIHTTRMVPKRAEEVLEGGSLYWVIRGQIMCREKIAAIRPFVDREGVGRCRLVLVPKVILVEPRPFRAFQGGAISTPRTPRAISTAPRPAPTPCPRTCGGSCASSGCCETVTRRPLPCRILVVLIRVEARWTMCVLWRYGPHPWLSSPSKMCTISVPGFSAEMLGSVSVSHMMTSIAAYFGVLGFAAIRSQALRCTSEKLCASRPVET